MSTEPLNAQHCRPQTGKEKLDPNAIDSYLRQVSGWSHDEKCGAIAKEFRFADYFHTMAFVNAVASIAHREDHHPDLDVGYARCAVKYSTHDAGGLSLNDFICAARVDDIVTGAKGAAKA
jgi:4a-hydroxytetrahydrobiopterin dehydratase